MKQNPLLYTSGISANSEAPSVTKLLLLTIFNLNLQISRDFKWYEAEVTFTKLNLDVYRVILIAY
jgi:hypothetical protein